MVSPFVLVFLLLPSLSKCDMVPPVKMPLRLTTGGDHSDPIATWNDVLTTTTMAALTAMPLQNFSQQCSATLPPSNPYLPLTHSKNEPSNPPTIHHHAPSPQLLSASLAPAMLCVLVCQSNKIQHHTSTPPRRPQLCHSSNGSTPLPNTPQIREN